VVGGLLKALEIATRDNSLREKLWANVDYFRAGAESLGLDLGDSHTQVFPIIIGGDRQMLYEQCIAMNEAGLFLAPVDYPSVPEDSLRYRVAITAAHEIADLDRALEILEGTVVKALREAGTLGEVRGPRAQQRIERGERLDHGSSDWQSMAKFLMRQATAIANSSNKRARVAQLSAMAYDHFVERARDPGSAYERLVKTWDDLDWRETLETMRGELRRDRGGRP
jgi:hypothetical protein